MFKVVFYARVCQRAKDEQAPPIPRIQVLGVTVSNLLSVAGHVSALLDICARTLRFAGSVNHVFTKTAWTKRFFCTVLAKLLYTSPAWSGFCSAADIGKLDRFLQQM